MGKDLAGTHAALLTGFADDGAFDPGRQRAILDHVCAQGLAGLYVGGSSGEEGLMATAELRAQQEVVATHEAAAAGVLIAHVGRPATRDALELARAAEGLGYHALSALPPHAYPFDDEEVAGYYAALASATALPLVAYEIPARTGRPLSEALLLRILALPGVVGLKFTSHDLHKMSRLKAARPDALMFHGYDETAAAGALLGADGGIGTTYNVLGRLYTAIFAAMRAGDAAEARALQAASRTFVDVAIEAGVLPACKLALGLLGVDAGPCRAPFRLRREGAHEALRAVLARPEIARWTAM